MLQPRQRSHPIPMSSAYLPVGLPNPTARPPGEKALGSDPGRAWLAESSPGCPASGAVQLRKGSGEPSRPAPGFLTPLSSTRESPESGGRGCEGRSHTSRRPTDEIVFGCVWACSLKALIFLKVTAETRLHLAVTSRSGPLGTRPRRCAVRPKGGASPTGSGFESNPEVQGRGLAGAQSQGWGVYQFGGRDSESRTCPGEWPEQGGGPGGNWTPGHLLPSCSRFRVWSRELETGHRRPGFEF